MNGFLGFIALMGLLITGEAYENDSKKYGAVSLRP